MLQESQILINSGTHLQFLVYNLLEFAINTMLGGGLYPINIPNSLWSYYHVLLIYFYLSFETNPNRFILWFQWALWLHLPLYLLFDVAIIIIFAAMMLGGSSSKRLSNELIIFILVQTTITIIIQSVYFGWIYGILEKFKQAADQVEFQEVNQKVEYE